MRKALFINRLTPYPAWSVANIEGDERAVSVKERMADEGITDERIVGMCKGKNKAAFSPPLGNARDDPLAASLKSPTCVPEKPAAVPEPAAMAGRSGLNVRCVGRLAVLLSVLGGGASEGFPEEA